MKCISKLWLITSVFVVGFVSAAFGQFPAVDVGSDGSFGAINITEDTKIDLPEDGILHATTVDVAEGATLTFGQNAINTPVYILAQGAINIDGTIDLRPKVGVNPIGARGGPGGFDGGNSRADGHGPGGGLVVEFDNELRNGRNAVDYASRLLIPLVGGSGGAGIERGNGALAGGGGGGAMLLASNASITVTGRIDARGNDGGSGTNFRKGASGGNGSLRLVAPTVSLLGRESFYISVSVLRIDSFEFIRNDTNFQSSVDAILRGANFVVFPEPSPKLEVVELAGEAVDPADGVALVQPPSGADSNTTIKVRAENFGQSIPITIALQPESGSRTLIETTINNSTENPVTQSYDITLPTNSSTRVYVWTR